MTDLFERKKAFLMKKQKILALLTTTFLSLSILSACGASDKLETSKTPEAVTTSPSGLETTASAVSDNPEQNQFTSWLPENIQQKMAESKANPALEKAIIDYYKIPKEELAKTKYYYNYVDLNGDGTDEILAVVMGPSTSGTGGDSMLWVLPYADMAVSQAFTLVNTPIIVTKEATNSQEFGAKGLIIQRSGGGAQTETVLLTNIDGEYENINDGKVLKTLEDVEGTAIICNNLIEDSENNNFLTLSEVK